MTQTHYRPIGELVINLDRKRVPVKASDRSAGPYPYYGASGVVDHVDDYLFEGLHLLVAEDGENLRSRNTPIAFLADGRFWVNNHAHVLRGNGDNDTRYLAYALEAADISGYVTGSAQPKLSQAALAAIQVPAPSLPMQRAIAATLGALDDKIESNRRAARKAQQLGDAIFVARSDSARILSDVADIVMGSSPKGADLNEDEDGLPFYQGTRDFGFRFPSFRVWTTVPVRTAAKNDTLMSVRAPVGELNRAKIDCCIGRGVAAIRSDTHPSTLYYALRCSSNFWNQFQGDGTVFASVNKADVCRAEIRWVSNDAISKLEEKLRVIDACIESLIRESQHLADLRDSLLPELLSGRVRVPVAEVAP